MLRFPDVRNQKSPEKKNYSLTSHAPKQGTIPGLIGTTFYVKISLCQKPKIFKKMNSVKPVLSKR